MKRSEFATLAAEYMGLGSTAKLLNGTMSNFADVASDAWYDEAVNVCASFGYVHGDGIYFHPDQTITYAEVAEILMNNLGIQTPANSWPSGVMNIAQQNGLFSGLSAAPTANAAATRGDIAIMVQSALHLKPSTASGSGNANGTPVSPLTSAKTLEAQTVDYTWYGDDAQKTTLVAVPGNGETVGNRLQVQANGQTTTLNLANNVTLVGASDWADLMNKSIHYLVNPLGLVCYMEVTP